jgi:hypothetical protein
MKLRRLLALSLLPVALYAAAPEPRYNLPAPALELVTHEEKFRALAEVVRADVERQLGDPARVDDPAVLKTLLSTRVHLAHHFADNEKAISTAAWIRSLQSDAAEKAFAGLTTLAAVKARQENPGAEPTAPGYRATFAREFNRQLENLPRTPEIVAMLRKQREKIAGLTQDALLAEVREVIEPALKKRGYCGLNEADQLVRVRHRLVSIIPVKAETLSALDAAIASRTSP